MTAKIPRTVSPAEYRALSGSTKILFHAKGGQIKKPTISRASWDRLSDDEKIKFMRVGGKISS